MGVYNVAEYGIDIYGDAPKLQYYAEPFITTAVSYTQVQLSWTQPAGDYTGIRVVRSNDGFPETAEDGAIIWEWDEQVGGTKVTSYLDGDDPSKPLVSGKFVYYRIWVKLETGGNAGAWKVVGDSYTLVPIKHATFAPDKTTLVDTKNKLLDVIPRVYTSASQSPIDEVDPNSDLSIFLDGFAFEIDRALTYADLLLPLEAWRFVSPDILALQSLQLGLPLEPYLATKQQRRLAREAIFIYDNKGTAKGIGTFVESLTGFAPDVTASPNLVLTPQDSTFTNGVGFWRPIGDVTIEVEDSVPGVTPATEPFVEDYRYVAKIVSNEVGSRIVNGADNPVTTGTPVTPGTAYTFSGYGKSAGDTMGVKGYALWYDLEGNLIEVDPPRTFVQTPQLVTSSWTKFSFVGRTPGVVRKIVSYSISSGALTFQLDTPNIMIRGETILVEGISTTIDGIYQIEFVGLSSIIVATTEANTAAPVVCSGTFTEAYPDLGEATLIVMGGEIVNGDATVTFAAPHGLSIGDKIIIQAMSTYFSFGVHTITGVTSTTVSFQIYEPYTGVENNTLDESWAVTSTPYGFAKEVIPDTATPVVPAYYASFELEMASEGTMYLDLLQMATFDVANFHEARAVEIFLNPTKTNYLRNPGFNPAGQVSPNEQWDVVAPDSDFTIDRTTIGLIGAGKSLEVETYSPLAMASYTVVSGVATVTLSSSHTLTADNSIVIAPPSYGAVIAATVVGGTATFTFAAPHSYPIATPFPLLVVGNNDAFTQDFAGVQTAIAASSTTVSFTTTVANKTYAMSTTPYGATAVYHPVYGAHELSAVGSGTLSFPVTWPDATSAVTLVAAVGVVTSVSTISAVVKSGRFVTASVYAKAVKNKKMTFSTTTTASDPGTGGIRFNSATYSSVTAIYIDNTDASGAAITDDFFRSLLGKTVTVENIANPSEAASASYVVTGVTNSTGYRTLTVTHVSSSGTFVTSSSGVSFSTDASESIRLSAVAVDGATSPVSIVASNFTEMEITEDWKRYSTTVFIPKVSPESVVLNMVIYGVTGGSTIYLDHAQVEDSYTATDYFDGAIPSANLYGAVWETTAHNSPTHLYPNLPAKITRLKQELPKYLPMNTSFLVQWYGGGIAKPIT
jgi:hypothetical protein